MKPPDTKPFPEVRITGETKAPRGWCFYCGEQESDGFPTWIVAMDESGTGESYRRRDRVPEAMVTSAMILSWVGFGIGCLLGLILGAWNP